MKTAIIAALALVGASYAVPTLSVASKEANVSTN